MGAKCAHFLFDTFQEFSRKGVFYVLFDRLFTGQASIPLRVNLARSRVLSRLPLPTASISIRHPQK